MVLANNAMKLEDNVLFLNIDQVPLIPFLKMYLITLELLR